MTCTNQQVRKLMKLRNTHTQESAASKSGMSRKTACKYLNVGKLPTELRQARKHRTRKDPFETIWPTLENMLMTSPGLEARTLLEWLVAQPHEPAFQMSQLRTLQRRLRDWRALKGPEQEVIFRQHIKPGKQSQSDYTCMNKLNITIGREPFPHLLFHFMLPYSRWETVSICFSESLDSLIRGYNQAIWELGAVAPEHRTDNLTAATHRFGNTREFNALWCECLAHYGVKPSRNNPGESHENGSVEKSHDLFKKAVEQQLLLRGSRDFATREAYAVFLKQVQDRRNVARQARLEEDMAGFLLLPNQRFQAIRTLPVVVSPYSTISVLKGVYSVPSRLIGLRLEVDVHIEHLDVRYAQHVIASIPRLSKDKGVSINYRHIISFLLRKPGAFANYQYRESLFPQLIFRKAYDMLVAYSPTRGHKIYLQILQLAAINNESDVAYALDALIKANEIPFIEAVKKHLDVPASDSPKVEVFPPQLSSYDSLIPGFASAQSMEESYVIN